MSCVLPLADGLGGLSLHNAQQKVEAAALRSVKASALLENANILPNCLPAKSRSVRGLFSILASFNEGPDELPNDSFVLSYRQHSAFHGLLANHPDGLM
jgi:hypothetical protein